MEKKEQEQIETLSRVSSHHPDEFTEEEKEIEKRLVRKLDFRLMIWAWVFSLSILSCICQKKLNIYIDSLLIGRMAWIVTICQMPLQTAWSKIWIWIQVPITGLSTCSLSATSCKCGSFPWFTFFHMANISLKSPNPGQLHYSSSATWSCLARCGHCLGCDCVLYGLGQGLPFSLRPAYRTRFCRSPLLPWHGLPAW